MSAMERMTAHRTVLTQLAVMSAHVMKAIWMKAMDLYAQVYTYDCNIIMLYIWFYQ